MTRMASIQKLFAATTILLAAISVAQANAPQRVAQHNDWGVYQYTTDGQKVCFAHSQPKQALPTGVNRDPIHFFVTTRPKASINNQISILIGYPFKEGSKVEAKIGGQTFVLFTQKDGAWVENAAQENRLIQAMRAGSEMVITGTSHRGTVTTDTYSLSGVTKALSQAAGSCG